MILERSLPFATAHDWHSSRLGPGYPPMNAQPHGQRFGHHYSPVPSPPYQSTYAGAHGGPPPWGAASQGLVQSLTASEYAHQHADRGHRRIKALQRAKKSRPSPVGAVQEEKVSLRSLYRKEGASYVCF